MAAKIEKTIARQKEKIAEGNYYEAHQQLRVIASRYLKSPSTYGNAADILSGGAKALLQAGQGGSGGDLALMLLTEVYVKGEWEVDDANRNRLFEILKAFPSGEPTRKRFVQEMVGWSSKFGGVETGDPEVHHVVGVMFAGVGNLASANKAYATFTSHLTTSNPSLFTQSVSSSKGSDIRVFPSLPLLNFLGLLLLSCQRGQASLFKELAKHYASHLKEKEIGEVWGWTEALANIGEIWFAIRIPRQSMGNPLFDMMGSMMFGGSGAGSGGNKGTPPASGRGTPAPSKGGTKKVEDVKSPTTTNSPGAGNEGGSQAPPTMDLD